MICDQEENRKLVEKYEAMSIQQKQAFLISQNAQLIEKRSTIPCMVRKYGERYWAYQLDCGWRAFTSSSENEAASRYKEFMEKVE